MSNAAAAASLSVLHRKQIKYYQHVGGAVLHSALHRQSVSQMCFQSRIQLHWARAIKLFLFVNHFFLQLADRSPVLRVGSNCTFCVRNL